MLNHSSFRYRLGHFFETKRAHFILGMLIIVAAVAITYQAINIETMEENSSIDMLIKAIVVIFAVEMVARLFAHGHHFFKNPWNVYDLIVVGMAVYFFGTPIVLLRFFRIFLFLRVFDFFPHFQHLLDAIAHAVPRMFSAFMLLFIAIYIFAVMGIIAYGGSNPELFGTIGTAFGTIFHSALLSHSYADLIVILGRTDPSAGYFVYPMVIVLNLLLIEVILGVVISALYIQFMKDEEVRKHNFLLGWISGKHKNHHDSPLYAEAKMIIHEIHKLRSDLMGSKKPAVEQRITSSMEDIMPTLSRKVATTKSKSTSTSKAKPKTASKTGTKAKATVKKAAVKKTGVKKTASKSTGTKTSGGVKKTASKSAGTKTSGVKKTASKSAGTKTSGVKKTASKSTAKKTIKRSV